MGDFTSEKEQKLLESEAEVSNTEDTNADELTFEEISGFSDDDDDNKLVSSLSECPSCDCNMALVSY